MLIITKDSSYQFVSGHAGGKALNLYLMSREGLPVPHWIALPPSYMQQYCRCNDIDQRIDQLFKTSSDFKFMAQEIERFFLQGQWPQDLKQNVLKHLPQFKQQKVAVRSSAIGEDSSQNSFAGQLSSYLGVQSENEILCSIVKCWASGFTERGLCYKKERNLPLQDAKVAVIIQKMVDASLAGVLFTCDPVAKKSDRIIINAVHGLGEGLVSGLYEGDTYTLAKLDGKVLSSSIGEQTQALYLSKDSKLEGPQCMEIDSKLLGQAVLTSQHLNKLKQLSDQVEDYYRFPQDVEWAIEGESIYLLQSRPVTTDVPNFKGHLYVWDNSNIVESYGGLTLPLTFDFARYVYHQVYVQFCEVLMVPPKHIKEMNFFLKNMLGMFYGRVYYNLLNWYKLTSILPGYKFNRKFMETMMGTDESLTSEIADRVRPPAFQDKLGSKLRKILTGFKFLLYHFRIQTVVDDFLCYFHSVYDVFRAKNYDRMPAHTIYADYQELEQTMLWKWHAPIINDFLCMVHFGIFKALSEKWLSHLGPSIQNDLLAGNGNLESAEPTRVLMDIAKEIASTPLLQNFILESAPATALEGLRQKSHTPAFAKAYQRIMLYIDKYGFRCMSEMKLEQKDLHQDPSLIFVFLKNILRSGNYDVREYEKREQEIRAKAHALVKKNLKGVRKLIYFWSYKHASKAVMNRENTRFCRTRIYGVVRSMFFGIGNDFTARGMIDCKEDIFYLSLEELKAMLEGHSYVMNLRKVIEARKSEYQEYAHVYPASRFFTRGIPYFQNNHFGESEEEVNDTPLAENQLRGIGCCPGEIEGIAKVIMGPEDDLELNGEILVTMRTDPGWIPLYPSASGLLVERGGLLSHSAIVAREMGLPTIVSIKGLTKKIKSGMKIKFNGESGLIEILD